MLGLPPIYPIADASLSMELHLQIRRLGEAGYPLVQFRGKGLALDEQWHQLKLALQESAENGGWPMICLNDRADLAVLAAEQGLMPWGLHLGQDDLPPSEARRLPGLENLHLGTSTHLEREWLAVDPACDHAGVGPFRATATKGDHAEPIGLMGLALGCRLLREKKIAPVAIGGLTLQDAKACFEAGAESLAMIGEVARSEEPAKVLWEAQRLRWQARAPISLGRGVAVVGLDADANVEFARKLSVGLGLPLLTAGDVQAGKVEFDSHPSVLVFDETSGGWKACKEAGYSVLWLGDSPGVVWSRQVGDGLSRTEFMAYCRRCLHLYACEQTVFTLGHTLEEVVRLLV